MRLILSVYGAALCLGNLWKSHAVQQSSSANAKAVTVLQFSAGLNITDRKKNSAGSQTSHIIELLPFLGEVVICIRKVSLSLRAHGVESVMAIYSQCSKAEIRSSGYLVFFYLEKKHNL